MILQFSVGRLKRFNVIIWIDWFFPDDIKAFTILKLWVRMKSKRNQSTKNEFHRKKSNYSSSPGSTQPFRLSFKFFLYFILASLGSAKNLSLISKLSAILVCNWKLIIPNSVQDFISLTTSTGTPWLIKYMNPTSCKLFLISIATSSKSEELVFSVQQILPRSTIGMELIILTVLEWRFSETKNRLICSRNAIDKRTDMNCS